MRGSLESLEEENITVDFLRHSLIVIRGYTRESEVYDAVQELVKGEDAAVKFASSLETLSAAYVATFNPEHEKWNTYPDATRRSIEVLKLLNIRPLRALLLSVAMKFSPQESDRAFQFLVSLGVRLVIASSTRSGSVEIPLARAANEIFKDELRDARGLKARLGDITPSNQEFKAAFETARVSKAQLARYYLRSLESAAEGNEARWFVPASDREVINLEHVLPKKPGAGWPEFDDESIVMLVNRLGNQALMLARDDSNLKSTAFVEKKAVYQASPYVLTRQLADLDGWAPEDVAKRQRDTAELAVLAWPV